MSTLKVHMTYQCSSACAHCRFACTRDPGAAIDPDLVLACVEALRALNGLNMVVLMGGEPGLYPDLAHRLAREIRALGPAVRVETNAFWAENEAAALAFLEPLHASGTSVMFSLDAFHEPFIPPERVERAVRACDALGMPHNLEMAFLDVKGRTHELDRRTDALLRDLETRIGRSPCCKVYQGNVFYNGRAAHDLAHLVSAGRGIPHETCTQVPWWYESWIETLDLLILDPDGYLSKGCGIVIDSLYRRSVADVIAIYDARQHPIFSTLLESGPLGLAREAEALGYAIKPDYADKCHLCQEAREVLRARYPEHLVPEQHYLV